MTKDQLRQCRREIRGLRDEIYQLEQSNKVRRSRATRTTTTMTDELRGANNIHDPIAEYVAIIADKDVQIVQLSVLLDSIANEVECAIRGLPSLERLIIRYYYIECLTWDTVARLNNFSVRYVQSRHGNALKKLC